MVGAAIDRAWQLEETIPTFPPLQTGPKEIAEADASALALHIGTISRHADEVEAASGEWVKAQRGRVEKLLSWFGPALLALAQQKIGASKPRRLLLPFGVLQLRKEPDRLVEKDDDDSKKAFRIFDSRNDHKWTRAKVTSDTLTHADLDAFVNAIPDELLQRFKWKVEAKKEELIKQFKLDGAIPPGFEFVEGTDRLKVDMVAAPEQGEPR